MGIKSLKYVKASQAVRLCGNIPKDSLAFRDNENPVYTLFTKKNRKDLAPP